MTTHRERRSVVRDSLPDDRLARAETALDAESVVDSDREVLTAAEQDSERIGHALAGYRKKQGWTHDDLAEFLGLTLRQLAALSVERRLGPGETIVR